MINLETGMLWKDIRQWVREGWFLYRPLGSTALVPARTAGWPDWQEHSSAAQATLSVHIQQISGDVETRSYPDLPDCIYPHWPQLGSINWPTHKFAFYAARQQQKQWCRTYNRNQIQLNIPKQRDVWRFIKRKIRVDPTDPTVVTAMFEPEYPSINAVSSMFSEGWASVAVTPQIIITNTMPRFVYFRGDLASIIRDGLLVAVNPRLNKRVEKITGSGGIIL